MTPVETPTERLSWINPLLVGHKLTALRTAGTDSRHAVPLSLSPWGAPYRGSFHRGPIQLLPSLLPSF